VAISFWIFRNKLIMKVSLPVSVIFYCLGAAAFCLSSIAYLGANDETRCLIRPIIFHLPLTLMISSMIWRVYRLWRILDNKTLQKMTFTVTTLIIQIFSLVFFDALLHVIRVLTGLKSISKANAGFSFTEIEETNSYYSFGHLKCTDDGDKWIMASGVLKVLLLLVAMYLTMVVQKMMANDKLGDAKPLMFASYNFSVFGVVYVFMSQSVDGGKGIVAAHALISFAATTSVLFVAVPKYIIIATIGDVSSDDVKMSLKRQTNTSNNNHGGTGNLNVMSPHTSFNTGEPVVVDTELKQKNNTSGDGKTKKISVTPVQKVVLTDDQGEYTLTASGMKKRTNSRTKSLGV
jgi:hypothetical protein